MQCHNCPKSITNGGTPDEECLSCKCADYLDNDFKTVIPVDDMTKVESTVDDSDSTESSLHENGELIDFDGDSTERNLEDCENVMKALKKCHKSSLKYIAILLSVFMMVGSNLPLFEATLDGKSFIEYAESTGTSKQNVYQTWNRMMEENPIVLEISDEKKKRKMKKKLKLG